MTFLSRSSRIVAGARPHSARISSVCSPRSGNARLVGREAWVACQAVQAERARQLLPEAVVGRGDEDPLPILAPEVSVRRQRRMAGAQRRRHGARQEITLGM